MPTFTSDAYLRFTANDIGTTLTPTGNFTHNSTNFNVFDDGDGNADTATDYFIAIPPSLQKPKFLVSDDPEVV